MPRSLLLGVLALLVFAASAQAQAPCPGAAACPYSADAVIGSRSDGVLRFPQAVAVGPDGKIYVADQYSHAIQVFNPDGTFVREIGSTGKGPGGLSSVGAVAVGPDGSVYVADGADRIDRFAADGSLLDSWGQTGSQPGEFKFGAGGGNDSGAGGGIAVAGGMVFVADTRNDRIQRFTADGTNPVVIVPKGRLSRPQGITVVGSRIVVADDDHHRLVVFDTGGRFIRTIGSGPGPQPNQLTNPYDVASDSSGRLYVADNSNHRVVRFGPKPSYVYRARWGSFGSASGQLQYPRGIAADAAGDSYVADPGNNRVDVFDIGGGALRTIGTSGRVPGQFIAPLGLAADASGLRAVADSVVGRVQLLNPDGSVAAVFGSPAPGPTLLPDPVAVAFDANGLVYVLDQQRSRVVVFDRTGKIIRTIGSRGTGAGQLLSPSALTFDAAGTLYVADTGNGRIARFGAQGNYLGSVGSLGSIRGVAVSADGSTIYAADSSTNRIYAIGQNGADLFQFGGGGTKPGKLRSPSQIALDGAGDVWVADRGNNRVEEYNASGQFIAAFGERGTAPGQFLEPQGLTLDCTGRLTVSDTDSNRVQAFQVAAPGVCTPLAAVVNPPAPVLPTQPKPVPPELTVKTAGTKGIFSSRALRLNVRCDVPCKVSIAGSVRDRQLRKKGKTPSATVHFKAQQLPAGKLTIVKATLTAADASRLRKALHGRSGLLADLRVTASTDDSAPTVVNRKYLVTG